MTNPNDQAHEMTLEERRKLVIEDLVKAEENFEPHTVSGNALSFMKWLQENTDTFDPVVVSAVLDGALQDDGTYDRTCLKFSEDEMKEFINNWLQSQD